MTTDTKLKFGWMTQTDAKTLVKTMELIAQTDNGIINTLEVGCREGKTSRAINQFFTERGLINFHSAIDSMADLEIESPFENCRFIQGNSIEVFNKIQNNSQHLIFIDANHSYPFVLADFLLYSDKLRIGGYMACHDTSPFIKPFTDYQKIGDKDDESMYISCRQALIKLGVYNERLFGFELVFDEYDPNAATGGITVVKRLT